MKVNIVSTKPIRDDTILVNLIYDGKHTEHYIRIFEKFIFDIIQKDRPYHFGTMKFDMQGFFHHEMKNKYYIKNHKFKKKIGNDYLGTLIIKEGSKFAKPLKDKIGATKNFTILSMFINIYPENHNHESLLRINYKNPDVRNHIYNEIKKHIISIDSFALKNVA